jgi:transcriptional regulator with XRE-family HTH domain
MFSVSPRRLRSAREYAHLSREQVAVAVCRSFPTIVSYERGTILPPADMLAALAELYGCDVRDFYADEPVAAR